MELIGNGRSARLPFQVVGPTTEVAFLEELIEERFGSLSLNPRELFTFLQQDPWVQEFFQQPQLVEGDLEAASEGSRSFTSQTLGNKLVEAGVLELEDLDRLLEEYRPFAATQRFGEFLRLNLQVSPQMIDLLLNPTLFDEQGFNEKRLGERLLELGAISAEQLEDALKEQLQRGGRIGEILAARGHISPTMARFFSEAKVNARGEIEYAASV
ncbi:hypothetical protein [Aphanothece microscopica]|uniref:hypothetical protein n=1 Tax=Aphanothece microscopica TaxID=1049561 RepID=UPI003CE4545C